MAHRYSVAAELANGAAIRCNGLLAPFLCQYFQKVDIIKPLARAWVLGAVVQKVSHHRFSKSATCSRSHALPWNWFASGSFRAVLPGF
jgi:hypothetical protein